MSKWTAPGATKLIPAGHQSSNLQILKFLNDYDYDRRPESGEAFGSADVLNNYKWE